MATAKGTAADPWVLKTPPLTSTFTMHRDTIDGTDMLVCKGLRGRFGMYVPPLLEALGLAEVEHNPRNNRMRAI